MAIIFLRSWYGAGASYHSEPASNKLEIPFVIGYNRRMYEFIYEIGPELIQSEYQHLHHADALRVLERARLDLLKRMGFPNEDLIRQGLFLVITSINVQYLRELVAGPVTVQCHSLRVEGRDLVIEQRALNSRGKRAVEATVTSCFMSGDTRRAMLPPPAFAAAFI